MTDFPVLKSEIAVKGLERPLLLAHITDAHLCEADARNDARLVEHARARDAMFSENRPGRMRDLLFGMIERANEARADALILTGDIIDFPSEANVDLLAQAVKKSACPCLYTLGNHDYSVHTFDRACLDARRRNLPLLRRAVGDGAVFSALDLPGVRLITFDDSLYQLEEAQLSALEAALSDGKSAILCAHVPFYTPPLMPEVLRVWRSPIVVGTPENEISPDMGDAKILPASDTTKRALALIGQRRAQIAATIAGHIHFSSEHRLICGIPQITTGIGQMRLISLTRA